VLLLLNQNLYKWRTTSRVWYLDFHHDGGIYRGDWDLHRLGEDSFVSGGGRPGGAASTESGFSSSCICVATKAQAGPPQTLARRPRSWAGQPAPLPTQPGVWPTWSTCQIHPRDDDDFDIWSTSICHPMKCSNLVPAEIK
jgi:hypothetical protein